MNIRWLETLKLNPAGNLLLLDQVKLPTLQHLSQGPACLDGLGSLLISCVPQPVQALPHQPQHHLEGGEAARTDPRQHHYGFINAKMKNHEYCSLAKLIKYILPIHFRFDFSKEY